MAKDTFASIKLLVADMLNLGVEPGRTMLSIRPESCTFWFAYNGAADREPARIAITRYLEALYGATDVSITSNQYAKSRFRFSAVFNTPFAINPADFHTEHIDLSKF